MTDREFYLVRLYLRKGGWRLTLLEIMNFDNGANWALLAFAWDRAAGFEVSVSG